MKKIFCALLSVLSLVLLTACNTRSTTGKPTIIDEPLKSFKKTSTITETILYNENNVIITATSLEYDSYSATLNVKIQNNSDTELEFISNSVGYSHNSVNGYMIDDGYLNCKVPPKETATEEVSFGYNELMLNGIFEIADMEIGFQINDEKNDNKYYTGPRQVRTNIAETYDYEKQNYKDTLLTTGAQEAFEFEILYFSDKVFHADDNYSVKSVALALVENEYYGMFLEIQNKANQSAEIASSNLIINGLSIYSGACSYDTFNPGKSKIVVIDLSDALEKTCWDAIGLNELGTVNFSMSYQGENEYTINPTSVPISIELSKTTEFKLSGKEVFNSNEIRILFKTIVKENSTYSPDTYIILFVENHTEKTIVIDDSYDIQTKINEQEADLYLFSTSIERNSCAVLTVKLMESELEGLGISSPEEIKTIEIGLEIEDDNYNEICKPTIKINN